MVIEVACYGSHQMYPVKSADIVLVIGVNEIVNQHLVLDALVEELQTVLPNHNRVDASVDNHQATFQLVGLVEQTCLLVAFGILLRSIHVAFAVHYLVVLPATPTLKMSAQSVISVVVINPPKLHP